MLQFDVITHTVIHEGAVRLTNQLETRNAYMEARKKETEARDKFDAEEKERISQYQKLRVELKADETMRLVMDEGKILTGDDVRPGDAGFELEVPPRGRHCLLLAKVLKLAGFQSVQIDENVSDDDCWWTHELASCWTVMQELQQAEFADGVVEAESLSQMLVEPDVFMRMRRRVEDELERRETSDRITFVDKPIGDVQRTLKGAGEKGKPSYSELSHRLGLTLPRLNWLHALFEGFLENEDDPDGPPPTCGYPDNPASLTKQQMKGLILELNPDLSDQEFEAHYRRIDLDGGGAVEFDEFVTWLSENQINLTGVSTRKMTFKELAGFYGVPVDVITYFHNSFQAALYELDEGLIDGYPEEPAKLPKDEIKALLGFLRPKLSTVEFESVWSIANVSFEEDTLDFSEFLEMIDFDDLPEELQAVKARASVSEPRSPKSPSSPSKRMSA